MDQRSEFAHEACLYPHRLSNILTQTYPLHQPKADIPERYPGSADFQMLTMSRIPSEAEPLMAALATENTSEYLT